MRYLIRGGYSPLSPIGMNKIITENKIGTNSGNILYLNGAMRSLLTSEAEFVVDEYKGERNEFTQADIERINQEFDAYIIPLANSLRRDFLWHLSNYTKLMKKLKIPCHILSVGTQDSYEPCQAGFGEQFDNVVREFVSAVLEHSPIVGIRGSITGDYLKRLGFAPERDFTIIGCPSMYIFGNKLSSKAVKLNKTTRVSVNFHHGLYNEGINHWLVNQVDKFYEDHHYVGQDINEFKCLYLGLSTPLLTKKYMLTDLASEHFKKGKVHFFVTPGDWFRYMKNIDLSIGGKLHGNIAAIVSGTPAIFIPSDARVRELVEYHQLPNIPARDWKESMTIESMAQRVDFDSYLKVHGKNLEHYKDFLHKLGLQSSFDNEETVEEKLLSWSLPVESILKCSQTESIRRWSNYINEKESEYKTVRERLKVERDKLKKECNRLKTNMKEISDISRGV